MVVGAGIGIPVMVAVLGRPPQRAALQRGLRHEREHELEHARSRVRAVREITVVAGRDREHAQEVEADADPEVAITAGYHRYFAHRAYATSRVFQFVLAFV